MTAITSACYFPPAIFFKQFLSADNILIDAHEYFVKQTLRNRAYICGANGKLPLIVPIKHTAGKRTSMREILICYDSPWQKIHWRSLTSAYRNSPYFEYYEDEISPYFLKQEKFLFDMNEKILHTLFHLLGIPMEVRRTEKFMQQYSAGEIDLRDLSESQFFFKSQYTEDIAPYPQVFSSRHEFINGLSMLDLLFNKGNSTLQILEYQKGDQ